MVVVVFGATGAIGSALAKILAASGRQAFLAGRNTEKVQEMLPAKVILIHVSYFAAPSVVLESQFPISSM